MSIFRQAGGWDVVVFDEGHKLTRYADGERAQRYRLAEMLRPEADAFLLLSGTPHQGYTDRFIALLELVRPDLRPEIQTLEANPEVVGEMILRNRKSEVTDADGNLIFKGQKIHRVAVDPSPETQRLHRQLQGVLAARLQSRRSGWQHRTRDRLCDDDVPETGVVEHCSDGADPQLRLDRLTIAAGKVATLMNLSSLSIADLSEGGDDQDDLPEQTAVATSRGFFSLEIALLKTMIDTASTVRRSDEKLQKFLDSVVRPLVREGRELLVFTEYRATQTYIEQALKHIAPEAGDVVLINGSMKLDEKLQSINAFNNSAKFLISTEAGGEGINLQQSCHIMVNYDLPWNPARLVRNRSAISIRPTAAGYSLQSACTR